jgi:hypothetical protein
MRVNTKSEYARHHFFGVGSVCLRYIRLLIPIFSLALVAISCPAYAGESLGHQGSFAKWAKVEIIFRGLDLQSSGSPNPFSIALDVLFTGPSGQKYNVPGFYDGDGVGGADGNVWKVRFSADEVGSWTFTSSSEDSLLNNSTGSFTVTNPVASAPDFYRWGRLESVGTPANNIRYLKFRDGSYWLKAGSDDPENFLGEFSNYNTPAERKATIDYLASKGINSQYLMTHNINGDDNDVWPWLGNTSSEAQTNAGSNGSAARFDVVKLDEWRDLFEHMQAKGVAVYMILEDDSAWTGYDHDRYYRELIARFGYLPALLLNIGEEASENYSMSQMLGFAQDIKDIDPYDHPIGIHHINSPDNAYVDASQLDFTAIQTDAPGGGIKHNDIAIDWINASKSRNQRVLVVGFDEPRPLLDREGWWSAYIGGGVWEVHVEKPYDRPVTTWEPAWTQLGGARKFMETLPFWEMEPSNSLVMSGNAFCLAKTGEAYALYLPNGGTISVDLDAGGLSYEFGWWNPSNGMDGSLQNTGAVAGGIQQFTAPSSGDWVLSIQSGTADNTRPNPPKDLTVQ